MQPVRSNIDVICTVKNELSNVKLLIADLINQTEVPSRIVIVDGGSSDGTYELLLNLVAGDEKFLVIQDVVDDKEGKSFGPIARGRNIAIRSCSSDFILMVDAGCRYHENWIRSYLNQINKGGSLFAGGSKLSVKCTDVDLAVAPILGFDLPSQGYSAKPTGTCRSLCVSRELHNQIGGFNEFFKTGEDTDFVNRAANVTNVIPVPDGAAIYTPNYGLLDACERLIQYAKGDGAFLQSKKRLLRMLLRALFQLITMVMMSLGFLIVPALYMLIEGVFAFRSGLATLYRRSARAVCYRYAISLIVPYLYFGGYLQGLKGAFGNANV